MMHASIDRYSVYHAHCIPSDACNRQRGQQVIGSEMCRSDNCDGRGHYQEQRYPVPEDWRYGLMTHWTLMRRDASRTKTDALSAVLSDT